MKERHSSRIVLMRPFVSSVTHSARPSAEKTHESTAKHLGTGRRHRYGGIIDGRRPKWASLSSRLLRHAPCLGIRGSTSSPSFLFRSAGLLLSGFVPWRFGPGKLSRLLSCCDLSAVLSDLAIRRLLHVYSWSHLREPMVITLCACEHSIKKRSNPSPMASRRRGLFF